MSFWLWLLVALMVLVLVGVAVGTRMLAARRRRTAQLRARFGPEYDRAVEAAETRGKAEAELLERLERREDMSIKRVSSAGRQRYEAEWNSVQAQFEESPLPAIATADALVTSVLAECGYPMESFDRRAGDLSVDHPDAVEHYRRAHAVYRDADDGQASAEDLYEALQHYRAVLDELLSAPDGEAVDERTEAERASSTP